MAQHSATGGGSVRSALRVIIVGAGFIAGQHADALRLSAAAELVGIVDLDPARAETSARQCGGVRWTTDLSQALSWPIDGVILCTPNDTHGVLGIKVAAAGKHLLVEKPLATDVGSARRLAAAFADAGRCLMAAHTHRFYDYARTVKAEIDSGVIGRPQFARLALLGSWIWPDWSAWMIDPDVSGGHALHNGVHLLDLVTWWMADRPVSVYARGHKLTSSELDIYDYLEMSVEFAGGGAAICEMSRGHRPAGLDRRDVLVVGSEGMISLPTDQWGAQLITEGGAAMLPPAARNGFTVQLDAWLDAIAGRQPAMSADEAITAVALGVAAEQSIARGEPVLLDELLTAAAR